MPIGGTPLTGTLPWLARDNPQRFQAVRGNRLGAISSADIQEPANDGFVPERDPRILVPYLPCRNPVAIKPRFPLEDTRVAGQGVGR
jgi:hypothetical protein